MLDDAAYRYRRGEYRAMVIRDLVLSEFKQHRSNSVLLDIGCGTGIDDDIALQKELAGHANIYLGIEPDPTVPLGPWFSKTYRSIAEEADVVGGSVDVAFAVMVLEHIEAPESFFEKIHDVLRPGGVFIGITMDARHLFCFLSTLMERFRLKEAYLRRLRGHRGEDRYCNYRTHYKANTPQQIKSVSRRFSSCECVSVARVGQLDYYYPRSLRWIAHMIDRASMALRLPGSILLVKLVK